MLFCNVIIFCSASRNFSTTFYKRDRIFFYLVRILVVQIKCHCRFGFVPWESLWRNPYFCICMNRLQICADEV